MIIILLRPHVKDNSKRKYLQKTKTQAIFEGRLNVKYFHINEFVSSTKHQVFMTKKKINITMLLKRTLLWCISSSRYFTDTPPLRVVLK